MEEKRLNLDAPLLSFRRLKALTFYNSDKITVPFDWEKTPGQPKDNSFTTTTIELNSAAPKLPPCLIMKENEANWLKDASLLPESETAVETMEEDDAFSDARESFSMKCSMSGGGKDSFRRTTMDAEVKDFMMGRFLPAAKAIADDLPPRTWRKPPRAQVNECEKSDLQTIRRRVPLDYQYQQEEEEEEEEYGYKGSSFLSSKACGLIQRFCLKTSIGLLRTHRMTSQMNVWQHEVN